MTVVKMKTYQESSPQGYDDYIQGSRERVRLSDPEIGDILAAECDRQAQQLEMIASENFASPAVLATQGSVLTNKYAEGYPGRRYYNGCDVVDRAETLAMTRAQELYNCTYANVQPHSGASANLAVFLALLKPGERFLAMRLDAGGHLSHGATVNLSGKWFEAVHYGLDDDGWIDMDAVRRIAIETQPKLIIAGGSAYPRVLDFAAFREIADEIGAYLMVDMAHFSGLVAGQVFPSPLPHAHVVTSTTHKTLRGPRGGMILSNDESLRKRLNSAVFPGSQGGPLMHAIAAKAVAYREAQSADFQTYCQATVANAQVFADVLQAASIDVATGGTDCHLVLADLRKFGISGHDAATALEEAGITCNKNSVTDDPRPPMQTSGLRFGSPALTTRGMGLEEFQRIGKCVVDVVTAVTEEREDAVIPEVRAYVSELCMRFPLYREAS